MKEQVTRRQILERIEQYEKEGKFSTHVDPIDMDNFYKVDENFPYILTKFSDKVTRFFRFNFAVRPFIQNVNKKTMMTKVVGRDNLGDIKSAVVVSNHVYMFDCLAQQYALKGHKVYVTAAEFNNQKGSFGDLMRAGKMLPMSSTHKGMKNFIKAVDYYIQKGNYVMFYPETAMWWMYEKPRPFALGAFNFAVRNNVPVIPSFITFITTDKVDEEGLPIKQFVINILKPLYPDNSLDEKEACLKLRDEAYQAFKKRYEEFYKKELTFSKTTD